MSLLLRDVFTIAGQATNPETCYHEATVVIAAPLSLCASFLFFFFSQKLLVTAAIWAFSNSFFRWRPHSTRTAFNSALPHWKDWSCKLLWGTQWSLLFCSHQNAESLRSSEMTPGAEETRAFWWPETSTTVLLSRMILLTAFMSEVKHCTFFLLLFYAELQD